ncbi:MAG: hypothetical protein K5821_17260 [Nitrobacter sp.]|uniref:hypothetical protein n=1 Tax=Nitrobacter sp. TaxID=29420 RepID=UPI00262CB083|nr:hypothetical protein [Nitrobacter sp.]MCV0388093.1 hypothetical protein [Nitrobacter sp.]
MTDEGRRLQIEKALKARDDDPPSDRPSHPLRWRGKEKYFPVIDLPTDAVLLNAESHRIRAELEAPEYEFVRKERTSARAQDALANLWQKAHRKFDKLKESLQVEGQTEPGVITREGLLVNGNTRLVALRELGRPWIRVAVLDSDARPFEIADLELRLQVRETGHDTYRLSNELLFIDEMRTEYGKSDEEIATALNWAPTRPAVGKKKVAMYHRLLQLVRELQRRDRALPITFFDDEGRGSGKLQQLKELEQAYSADVAAGDMAAAEQRLDVWLLLARSGYDSVHQIRPAVRRDDFLPDYLIPALAEQEPLRGHAERLAESDTGPDPELEGLELLGGPAGDTEHRSGLAPLLSLVEAGDGVDVNLPGADSPVNADAAKAAVRTAIKQALRLIDRDDQAEDELNAPVDALRNAARELKEARALYAELQGTHDFEQQSRGPFEYQTRQVKKALRDLEDLIARG